MSGGATVSIIPSQTSQASAATFIVLSQKSRALRGSLAKTDRRAIFFSIKSAHSYYSFTTAVK